MSAMGQMALELPGVPPSTDRIVTEFWHRVGKFDPRTAALADRHYNRRKVGAPQFMPPGQTIVLLSHDEQAVWGWWRPDPASGIPAINGLDGWTCTIFRNESPVLSSTMILDAEEAWYHTGYDCGPDGFLTYVWDSRIRSANPGYCFKQAGWEVIGRSADGRKTLLHKNPGASEEGPAVKRAVGPELDSHPFPATGNPLKAVGFMVSRAISSAGRAPSRQGGMACPAQSTQVRP